MRVFAAFVAYLLGALLLSALLLPFVYPGVEALLGDETEPSSALSRLAMLLMLAGFPWLLKRLDLFGWRELGFVLPARAAWTTVLGGLGAGFMTLAVLSVALVVIGAREYSPPDGFAELLAVVIEGLVAGLLVGAIEEAFFRGMMHTGMRRSLSPRTTIALTSAFYASLHFIQPDALPTGTELDLTASLSMLATGLAGLADVTYIADSFVALFVAGVFLSMVRERTGHIGWGIGIHAGWVLVISLTKFLTDADRGEAMSIWIGHYDKVNGWLSAIGLGLLALQYAWFFRRADRIPPSRPQLEP